MPITLEIFFLLYSSIKRFYESPFKVWAFKLHMASTISAKWLFVILAESLMYESMQLEYLLEPTIFFFFSAGSIRTRLWPWSMIEQHAQWANTRELTVYRRARRPPHPRSIFVWLKKFPVSRSCRSLHAANDGAPSATHAAQRAMCDVSKFRWKSGLGFLLSHETRGVYL